MSDRGGLLQVDPARLSAAEGDTQSQEGWRNERGARWKRQASQPGDHTVDLFLRPRPSRDDVSPPDSGSSFLHISNSPGLNRDNRMKRLHMKESATMWQFYSRKSAVPFRFSPLVVLTGPDSPSHGAIRVRPAGWLLVFESTLCHWATEYETGDTQLQKQNVNMCWTVLILWLKYEKLVILFSFLWLYFCSLSQAWL